MKAAKRKNLEKQGWKVGSVQEFLGLSDHEMALIEMKRVLIQKIKDVRKANRVTQATLAKLLESSQSRVAKLEAGEAGISLDLICRALFALGINQDKLASALLRRK